MLTDPHLFFAEVSLDLSRGEFHSALEKIELHSRALEGTHIPFTCSTHER